VTNLLEFTRARRENEAASARVDCRAAADDALRWARDVIDANGIVVARAFATTACDACGDAALLRPALLNLVRNAVQAMPEGGTLTVTVGREAACVAITIADTGPGVPDDVREAIFAPFFTTRTRGTGLGLTVVRALVTALGGEVQVANARGGGAAFTVRLGAA
jgi:signal transduction histidine kinase